MKSNEKTTDVENNCQAMKALNAIYLDGDWIFTEAVESYNFESSAIDLAEEYQNVWFQELYDNNVTDFYYFTF